MRSASVSSRLITPVALAAALLFFVAISPNHAAAQTIPGSIQTQELIPPGQDTCQMITVTSIQPYVYGGEMESFDVTISDTDDGYVGILAAINNEALPLNYITRWAGSPSGLRIHVDTPDTAVNGSVPVTLTLLSSLPGQPTCITTVAFNVSGTTVVSASNSTPSSPTTPQTSPASSQTPPQTSQTTKPSTGAVSSSIGQGTGSQVSTVGTSTTATSSLMTGSVVASASNMKLLSSICSGSNAYRLWLILLVIYLIIVTIVVFAEPWFLETSVIGSTAVILVPLILLLGFWYLSSACRAASWIPVLACVIAIVGLFLAFREYEMPPLLPAASE